MALSEDIYLTGEECSPVRPNILLEILIKNGYKRFSHVKILIFFCPVNHSSGESFCRYFCMASRTVLAAKLAQC